ncbi:hypothetical protein AVEN_261628-1 [Araneus ventricosus]|uniref:Uncharacterized protein n=1 Tax=Araneus ventricosus TaxID=182803 RepID=A0A4Y2KFD9_ARAVE|nr:hypothetical protein AVEN_261628-1 [Araneus ventricosus]
MGFVPLTTRWRYSHAATRRHRGQRSRKSVKIGKLSHEGDFTTVFSTREGDSESQVQQLTARDGQAQDYLCTVILSELLAACSPIAEDYLVEYSSSSSSGQMSSPSCSSSLFNSEIKTDVWHQMELVLF